MRHFMVDIETLSTSCSRAVITQIGIIEFNQSSVFNNGLHLGLRIDSQILAGRIVNEDTLRWWGSIGKSPFLDNNVEVPVALEHLDRYINANARGSVVTGEPVRIWANGIVFDIGNLSSLYEHYGLSVPWQYNSSVDMRTVRRMCGGEKLVDPSHSALDDAYHQAEWVADNAAGYILELERE